MKLQSNYSGDRQIDKQKAVFTQSMANKIGVIISNEQQLETETWVWAAEGTHYFLRLYLYQNLTYVVYHERIVL